MKVNGKNIFMGIIAFVLTIALLLAGQYIWNKTQVEQPLNQSLTQQAGVSKWDINYEAGHANLNVTFKKLDNFQVSYTELTTVLDKVLGAEKYTIEITNPEQPKLNKFYQDVQPVLYEGLATGRYTWMVQKMTEDAQAKGFSTQLQFDQKYVYLQIDDQNISLYKLIPRENDMNQVLVYNK